MRRPTPSPRSFALALVLSGVAACAVGPDYQTPPPPAADALGAVPDLQASGSQTLESGGDVPARWWQLFRSPALDTLVEQALAHNPDVEAAQAALRAARETALSNAGGFFPTLTGSFAASREKDAANTVQPNAANNAPQLTLFTPQLAISYEPDLWGGVRRGQESQEAQVEAQRFQTEATYLTLTSTLVVTAVGEAGVRDQIAATRDIIAQQEHLLAILRRQQGLGQASGADVAAQEAALAQARQTLPPLEKALEQGRHQLNALLGRLPGDPTAQTFQLADLTLPADLPLSVPARLVEHRPDIRVAAANLHTASAEVGVAVADRLPNLTLTAATGSSASLVDGLFTTGNGFWNVGAALSAPLFDGFSRAHKEKAARAALAQAAAQYRSAVTTAFQNVADVLSALKTDGDALKAAVEAQDAAARSLAIARRQLELGAVAPATVLAAQQTWQQARLAQAQARVAVLSDTAALFQALGGGWWNTDNGQDHPPGHAAPAGGGLVTW